MDEIWLDDYIVDIAEGKNGRMYILNRRQILSYENNQYVEIVNLIGRPKVRQIEEDDFGRLWILYHFNENDPIEKKVAVWDTKDFTELDIRYFFDSKSKHLLDERFSLLMKDSIGRVHFLHAFNDEHVYYQESEKSFKHSKAPHSLRNGVLLKISDPTQISKFKMEHGQITLSTVSPYLGADQGISYTLMDHSLSPIESLADSIIQESNYPLNHRTKFKFLNSEEFLIYNDKEVTQVNLRTKKYVNLTSDFADMLSNRTILSIQKIANKLIVGTTKGIISVSESTKDYKSFLVDRSTSIRNIHYISNDSILIATRYGLALYNPTTSSIEEIDLDNVKYGVVQLGNKIITTSYSSSFYMYDVSDIKNSATEVPLNRFESMGSIQNSLALDSNRIIFVGSGNAFLYHLHEDRLDIFDNQNCNHKQYTSIGMMNNKLAAFGSGGSCYLDIESMTKSPIALLEGLTVTSIFNENPSNNWICTKGSGLIKYNSENSTLDTFDISDGLLSLNVHSAHKDNRNRLWLSTDYGISVMDTKTEDIITITTDDGIHENEMNRHAYLALSDGSVIYGSINGIIHFDPNQIEFNNKLSSIYLGKLVVKNTRTNNIEAIEHPREVSEINILSHYTDPNLHFESGHSNKFKNIRYKLLGAGDNQWHRSNNGIISLGKEKEIKGILIESREELNTWSDPYVFNINFHKPFYQNQYLYIIGLLVGLSLLLFFTRNAQKNSEKRTKLIQTQVDNQTTQLSNKILELSKSNTLNERLFFIIGHDLKSPLTSLLSLNKSINYLIEKGDYTSLTKLGDSIESNSRNVLGVIDRLLDWATSLRNTEVVLNPLEIKNIIDVATQDLKESLASKEIQIDHIHLGITSINSEKESLIIILRNLIQNAIKYSDKGSTVTIKSKVRSTTIVIAIEDKGMGMSKSIINQINKGDIIISRVGTLNEKGLGIGLRICKELATRLNGTLTAAENQSKGSIVTLIIPR